MGLGDFTDEEIAYAMANCGDNWKERAALRAKNYVTSGVGADQLKKQLMDDGFKSFDGESNAEFRARATEFLDKVKALGCDNVAAFTHAGFLRTSLSIIFSANINTMNFVCSNCAIVILELKDGRWMLSGLINPQ